MENRIVVKFRNEDIELTIDYDEPDFTFFIQTVIRNHLNVSAENISIECNIDDFDCNEFKEILIEVHNEFKGEIDQFFQNIRSEIRTYYDSESLSEYIIDYIKKNEEKETI